MQPTPLTLRLSAADGQQAARLRYAARLLLESAGLDAPVETVRPTDAGAAGLLFEGQVLASVERLEQVFAAVSLQREAATGRFAKTGMFDEGAVAWDVSKPWVDVWASQLAAQLPGRPAAAAPEGPFRVIISHDVDRTTTIELTSWLHATSHALGLRKFWFSWATAVSPKAWLKSFERLLERERAHGVGAYYFMLAGPYGLRRYSSRTDIHWQSARRALQLIRQAGMTVGLHGSYYARERDSYRAEKDRLEQALAAAVTCHRNHYLRFDPLRMWSQLEAAGFQYDFSIGFSHRLGFRAGCARPYRGFDFPRGSAASVITVPLLFMDGMLMDEDRQDTVRRLRLALEEAKRVHGCVSLLFHPTMFLIHPATVDVFDEVLVMCRELGADLSGKLPSRPSPPGASSLLKRF